VKLSRSLGEAEARIALDACLQELQRRGDDAVVAVADNHGELIALWRTDGCGLAPIAIAQNKAYTAARLGRPTGDVGRDTKASGDDVHYHGDARYVGWDGGVPVLHNGACLGAVAVSGLSGEDDLAIADIGVSAILNRLD
jgi:glc operon protein GlcG